MTLQANHLVAEHRGLISCSIGVKKMLASMNVSAISGIHLFLIYTNASMTRPVSIHSALILHLVGVVLVVT